MGQDCLEDIMSCLCRCAEKAKELIDHEVIYEHIWSTKHEWENVSLTCQRASTLALLSKLNVLFNPLAGELTVLGNFFRVTIEFKKFLSVRVEPVYRVSNISVKTVQNLAHDNIDRLFDSHSFGGPLLIIFNMQCDKLIT